MRVRQKAYLMLAVKFLAFMFVSVAFGDLTVNKQGEFFRLNSPIKISEPVDFSLRFEGTGDVYLYIENEDKDTIHWSDKYFPGGIKTITNEWEDFSIEPDKFKNLGIYGKFKVTCRRVDIGVDKDLWSAWFVRDHKPVVGDNSGNIIDLLDKYSPYVYFGKYSDSSQADANPWDYDFPAEIYYPIDIKELVTTYAPNLDTDGTSEYSVTVGKKSEGGNDCSLYRLDDANNIRETASGGIDIASYNDAGLEYGITRKWSCFPFPQFELLEFVEESNDAPYVSEVNLFNFTGNANIKSNSKIYGTAYEYEGYIFLQYFFYYPFDPKNNEESGSKYISRHSGEVERVVVVLKKDSQDLMNSKPKGMLFFHHLNKQGFSYHQDKIDGAENFSWNIYGYSDNFGGAWVNWDRVNKTGNNPHVYVAQGSHGCYFREGSYTVDTHGIIPLSTTKLDLRLKEYAGGQTVKKYSALMSNPNLIYLPRLSEIDTKTNNTEFSFLLFSGVAAQTETSVLVENLMPKNIAFPPYNDVWYNVEKYCPVDDEGNLQPKNNVTGFLDDNTDPTVSIISPSNNDTVNGIYDVTASAEDDGKVRRVEFYLDNLREIIDTSPPYSWDWDTTKYANGSYNLSAKAYDRAGNVGISSPSITVTVNNTSGNNPPNIPTFFGQFKTDGSGIGIGGTTDERSVVLKGDVTDPDGNAVSLDVEVRALGTAFSNSPSTNCSTSGSVASGGTASVTCSGLEDDQYHWQARTKDINGAVSNWRSAGGGNSESEADFIVSAGSSGINYPPTVTLISPNGGETLIAGSTYEIKWIANDNQELSIFLLYSSNGGALWDGIPGAAGLPNTGSFQWDVPDISTGSARVRVLATDGELTKIVESASNFSIVNSCIPPFTPTLYDPGLWSETGNYNIFWQNIGSASEYLLQESTSSSFVGFTEYTTVAPSKYISGKANGIYYYRVKAVNDCNGSGWSNVVDMEARVNAPPNVPANPFPSDRQNNVERNQPILSWTGGDSDGTVEYAVRFDTNPNPGFYAGFGQVAGTSYQIPGTLKAGTRYYWAIKARDDKGLETESPIWSFTTEYSYPDLAPLELSVIGNVAPDAQVTLNLTVKNQGTFTAPSCRVYFYNSSTAGGKEQKLNISGTTIPRLTAGEQTTVSETVTLNNLKAGQSYIDAWIDTQGCSSIGDNISNNTISKAVEYLDNNNPVITFLGLSNRVAYRTGYECSIIYEANDDIGISTADLYYSTDNGATWIAIIIGLVPRAGGGSYSWMIPSNMPLTDQLQIKMVVWDTVANSAEAVAGPYTVVSGVAPVITILSPNGGEVWEMGSTQEIRWDLSAPNGLSGVSLSFEYPNGIDSIAGLTSNIDGTYSWTLRDNFSTKEGKIRIYVEDLNGNASEDRSDGYFEIKDTSAPPPAPWTTPKVITEVPSADSGTKDHSSPQIVVDSSGNTHMVYKYHQDITGTPRLITDKILYKKRVGTAWSTPMTVYSITQETDSGLSGYYSIRNLQIALDNQGYPHIVWRTFYGGQITNRNQNDIYYTYYNGSSWSAPYNISIDMPDIGGTSTQSESPRIQIDSSNTVHVVWQDGRSWNSDFTINGQPNIYYRTKGSNDVWSSISQLTTDTACDSAITIDNNNNVHLAYLKCSESPLSIAYMKWNGIEWSDPIIAATTSDGYIDLVSDDKGRLYMVWYYYNGSQSMQEILYSYYDGTSWSPSEKVSVDTPGSQSQQPSIVVDSLNRPHVIWEIWNWPSKLLYRYKDVGGWSPAIQLHFDSQIVSQYSSDAANSPVDDLMHVVWTSGGEVLYNYADVSSAPDTSAPVVTVTNPSVGESLSIGTVYNITWDASDNVGVDTITIEYTIDGGTTYTPIATNEANDGSYQWTVPNILSDTVQIRITASDVAENSGYGTSGIFSILDGSPPSVTVSTPNGGEIWIAGSQQNIVWSATDNVGVSSIDLQYSTDGGNSWVTIVQNITNSGSYLWAIPDILTSNALVKVVAHDDKGLVSEDSSDALFSIVRINNPPVIPHSPSPLDNETAVSLNTTLSWIGGDIDGDTVTYDIYFGTDNNPPKVSSGQTVLSFDPGTLIEQTVYYWKLVASDGKNTSIGPLWTFTTGKETINAPSNLTVEGASNSQINLSWSDNSNNESGFLVERKHGLNGTYVLIATLEQNTVSYLDIGLNSNTTYIYRVRAYGGSAFSVYSSETSATTGNTPPNVPGNPMPTDGSLDQSIDVTLRWSGGDPDIGDSVSYDVYFGTTANPPLVSSDQPDAFYSPGILSSFTTYYWKIISKDSQGGTSIGPLWYFVTQYEDDILPLVTITSPTEDTTYNTSTNMINLGGTASDNVGVTKVIWENDNDESGAASGTTNWAVNGITLQEGTNVITVTAQDAANNTETDTLTVTYNPPETSGPVVSNLTPSKNPITEGVDTSITISATVDDSTTGNSNIAGAEYYIGNSDPGVGNGTPMNPVDTFDSPVEDVQVTIDTASWTAANSPYTVNIRGTDNAGNWGNTQSIDITVNPYQPVNRDVCSSGCQYSSIQQAIDDALPGDTIRVAQGTYYENIFINNTSKNFILEGGWNTNFVTRSNDPSLTIIDGGGINSVFRILDADSIDIKGFTITNASAFPDGGAIYAFPQNGASFNLSLSNNIITGNTGAYGGVFVNAGANGTINLTITNNIIRANSATINGGGIAIGVFSDDSSITITNNIIEVNTSDNNGGGIWIESYVCGSAAITLTNNTITGNTAYNNGGGNYFSTFGTGSCVDISMKNEITWGNSSGSSGGDLYVGTVNSGNVPSLTITYSDIGDTYGNYTDDGTNINIDPLFVDSANSDFHLSYNSSLIDAGTNTDAPLTDFEGDTRPYDGDNDGTETVDMGADEYVLVDTDKDGILDSWEISNFGDLTTADETTDYDNDGLLDKDEYANNTDPKDNDSDNDGMDDGWEVAYGLDPLIDDSADDKDGDGTTNLQEYLDGSDPAVTTPTVTSITPSSGTNDGSVDITDLTGINFRDPPTVKLTKTGETDIIATNVSFVNSTRLACAFNLAGAELGTWNVEITIPNGETGVLQNGFTVSEAPSNNLLGHWKFDDGGGSVASDSSGNGNHGTVNGGAAWTATGKAGGALDFDGVDDYVDVGDIDLTDAFTIAAWIKLSSKGKYMIVGKSWRSYQLFVTPAGRLVFYRNSSAAISYKAGLAIDTWYHVAVTFNTADGTVMYLNGRAVAANGDTTPTKTNNVATKIGATGWTAKKFFQGTLDEVRVYNTALTARKVQGLVGGLVAHYAFEGNADDSSGNGNHGTVNGGAAWTATGKAGGALDFDGVDDYVDVGDIDLTDAFTIAAWIKLSSKGKYMIVGKSWRSYQLFVTPAGRLVFYRNSSAAISYKAGLAIDTWYHVAVTFNTADGTVLYLNGRAVAANDDTTPTKTNNVATKIGATGWTAKKFFQGTLDEVRVYDTALTAREVKDLYNQFTVTVPYATESITVDGNLNESERDITTELKKMVIETMDNTSKKSMLLFPLSQFNIKSIDIFKLSSH